jgi:uncharacterized protein YllA (UPF0747 family)
MSKGVTLKLEGLDKALAKLDLKEFEQDITDELAAFGFAVVRDAKETLASKLKYSIGGLINSIDSKPSKLSVEIVANRDYAAYVEFGTGRFAAALLPSREPEWQALAREFYVNGMGRMPATPYLHPAYEKNRLLLIENLKNLLNA